MQVMDACIVADDYSDFHSIGRPSPDVLANCRNAVAPLITSPDADRSNGSTTETKWETSEDVGATRRNRTGDLLITNQLLYQLS
jgi:hypothetical protein